MPDFNGPETVDCPGPIWPGCKGKKCPTCKGSGKIKSVTTILRAEFAKAERDAKNAKPKTVVCDNCEGDGCEICSGSGEITKPRKT